MPGDSLQRCVYLGALSEHACMLTHVCQACSDLPGHSALLCKVTQEDFEMCNNKYEMVLIDMMPLGMINLWCRHSKRCMIHSELGSSDFKLCSCVPLSVP